MKKFDNFCSALDNLKDIYNYEPPYNNVIMTGLVALYEICFEQSWKVMKEMLTKSGFPEGQTGSPRQILKTAYQSGMITDEKAWLSALDSRNNVAHAYNSAIALDIIKNTKDSYCDLFTALKEELTKNWI